ncbi:hypothetical protein C0Q70_14101 [Pomacea canaliculata]|uniref:Uncharacterized protein n=1 Tax=Pomacea canaliculata TaxID=400727 RepID=A0A2T7NZ33_POMCA|nr:hypothetical protein C0Q70_14101 [Pomacea canaliculata]
MFDKEFSEFSRKWTIQGEKTLFTQALPSKANEDLSVYSTIWTVDGFEVTRRGRREKIHFFFEALCPVNNGFYIIYPHKDNGSQL